MIPAMTIPGPTRRRSRGHVTANDRSADERGRHRGVRRAPGPTGLVTDRGAARMSRVSPGMLRLWVETGAWPLPRAVHSTTLYFVLSDVEGWIRTGTWPAGARFRSCSSGWPVKEGRADDER